MFHAHAQVGVADAHASGNRQSSIASAEPGDKISGRLVKFVCMGVGQNDFFQVGLGFDQSIGDHLHSFVRLALNEAGRGDAEGKIVEGDDLQNFGRNSRAGNSEQLGHRGFLEVGALQELFRKLIVYAALDPGDAVGLFKFQGREDSFSGRQFFLLSGRDNNLLLHRKL